MKLHGIFVDTTTPFDHNGSLYRVKIEHNIGKWNQTSVSGYVVGGFTGEGALLSSEEKRELWAIAAAAAAPEKVLIAGVENPGVHEAARMVNHAAELGYPVALLEPPPDDKTRLLYFRSVADRTKIPILMSPRSGISAETVAHPNVCREALCGSARTLWSALQNGASGAILAFANAAPYAAIALWEAYRTREEEAGLDWQARIAPAGELIETVVGIPGLKHAMDGKGYYGGPPRLPLTVPTPAEKMAIEKAFADL